MSNPPTVFHPASSAQLEPRGDSSAQTHYWRYHRLFHLLGCKQALTNSMDEDLFITVHQVAELSFHQMILDLDRALTALAELRLDAASAGEAAYFLDRVVALYATVNRTVPVLADMRGFVEFRQALGPAGLFQSFQFRRIEIMSGITEPYWRGPQGATGKPHPAEAAFEANFGVVVEGWLDVYRDNSLRHHYEDLLAAMPGSCRAARLVALRERPGMRRLLELFKAYDDARLQFHRLRLVVAAHQRAGIGVAGTSARPSPREHAPLFAGLEDRPGVTAGKAA